MCTRSVAVVITLLVASCAGPARVVLQAPSADASLDERERAYQELKPLEQVEHVGVAVNRVGNTTVATPYRTLAYLQLNDGRRVIDPRDLEPVVTPSSPTGKAIVAYDERMRGAANGYWIATGIAAAGSAVLIGGGLALAALSPPDDNGFTSGGQIGGMLIAGTGATFLLSAPAIGVLGAVGDSAEAQRERETAFNLYDRSLRMKLGLEEEPPELRR